MGLIKKQAEANKMYGAIEGKRVGYTSTISTVSPKDTCE
jgi:hypothetical protein